MKRVYIKPEIKVFEMEEIHMLSISQVDVKPGAEDSDEDVTPPGIGEGDAPENSKGGLWDDDFEFSM